MRFQDQRVVITGGTRGLGRAMTCAFLSEGAHVFATYRGNTEAAERMKEEVGSAAERLSLHAFDVADHEACASFWGDLEDQEISVLVANSGIRQDNLLATMSPEQWSSVLDTNLSGSYHMAKFAVLNMMRKRYGRILFVTSPAGRHGFEGQGNYSASKAGQVGLMRSLCKEVAKRKITVNCISPGFIATDLISDLPDDVAEAYKKSVPMKRFGNPEEVASAALFLASEEASYITGSVLEVTGGL